VRRTWAGRSFGKAVSVVLDHSRFAPLAFPHGQQHLGRDGAFVVCVPPLQAFLEHVARKRRLVLINEFLSTKASSCCQKDGVLVTVNPDRTVTCACGKTCVVSPPHVVSGTCFELLAVVAAACVVTRTQPSTCTPSSPPGLGAASSAPRTCRARGWTSTRSGGRRPPSATGPSTFVPWKLLSTLHAHDTRNASSSSTLRMQALGGVAVRWFPRDSTLALLGSRPRRTRSPMRAPARMSKRQRNFAFRGDLGVYPFVYK